MNTSAQISTAKVIEACRRAIRAIKKSRDEKKQEAIATEIRRQSRLSISLFGRLTPEGAEKRANDRAFLRKGEWHYVHGRQLLIAERVLKLAYATEHPFMTISARDYDDIGHWEDEVIEEA